MATELIINASLPETRIALMENGEIQELLIERASGKGIVGNIYKGRVTRVLPGMQAAFVDIGLEKAAFLYVDDVYVHPEIWEEEESAPEGAMAAIQEAEGEGAPAETASIEPVASVRGGEDNAQAVDASVKDAASSDMTLSEDGEEDFEDDLEEDEEEEDEDDEDDQGPVGMGPPPGDGGDESGKNDAPPEGTFAPVAAGQDRQESFASDAEGDSDSEGGAAGEGADDSTGGDREEGKEGAEGTEGKDGSRRRRHRRGRRGGRYRSRRDGQAAPGTEVAPVAVSTEPVVKKEPENLPVSFSQQVDDPGGEDHSDRSAMREADASGGVLTERPQTPEDSILPGDRRPVVKINPNDFNSQRTRDRRIRPRTVARPVRAQVNIQDLLKEGQEVIVQVAKDPIATKGARLTCHISLPGRHLVCMPTIDHVGVSRRIERDDERRKLREFVDRNRPRNLGFIVRTASGRGQSEKRIKQDIDYLTRLWTEIREKAATVTAPALVYEDLNAVLRAIRDWVTEDINKIIVDSRYHYNEIQRFVSHFMPAIRHKVELYHGDIPIFDAYNISTELSRALERKVWLKSGGYLVVDQAEALVAIDVNTGRYVGKKNLEDTILKTNLEAVQEIAYQLRLRNCGGIIILDLIDMEKEENKQRVYRALEEALKKDRARPSILKISELGLIEMTRKRTRDTIVRSLCESCSHCEGKGFIKSKQTVGYEVLREIEREGIEQDVGKILVQAHPDVIDLLAIDERETLDQLERRYRKQIYLQAVTDFHPEQFEVMGDKKAKAVRGATVPQSKAQGGEPQRDQNRDRGGRDRNRDRGANRDRGRDRNRGRGGSQQIAIAAVEPGTSVAVVGGQSGNGDSPVIEVKERMISQVIINSTDHQESVAETGGNPSIKVELRSPDEQFDEEDRLAFLRAQATQDAALARLRNAGEPLPRGAQGVSTQLVRTNHQAGGARDRSNGGTNQAGAAGSGASGGRNNRRRRGGKFRSPAAPKGMPVKSSGGPSPIQSVGPVAAHEQEVSTPSDSSGSGESGGGSTDSGSSHSQPPV